MRRVIEDCPPQSIAQVANRFETLSYRENGPRMCGLAHPMDVRIFLSDDRDIHRFPALSCEAEAEEEEEAEGEEEDTTS